MQTIKTYLLKGFLIIFISIIGFGGFSFLGNNNPIALAGIGDTGLCSDTTKATNCVNAGGLWELDFGGSINCTCKINPSGPLANTPNTSSTSLDNMAAILDVVLNVLYIIIWPLLTITGLALDNSLVYGEVFGMTDMLYKFWRIMMNISFILLTIGILRDILKSLAEGKIYEQLGKKILNRFLAGLFIPLSRFIVSGLVDLSTIMIYQVGSIPLTVLKESDGVNLKILNNHSVINLADPAGAQNQDVGGLRFKTIYSCGGTYYAVCKQEGGKLAKASRDEYRSGVQAEYTGKTVSKDFCAFTPTSLLSTKTDINFNETGGNSLRQALLLGSGEMTTMLCDTVKDLINKSKSMVGPLYTIYGSLLNFTSLNVTTSGKSTEAEVMLFLIKGIVGLLLIIPLIALAGTSIARVGILWIVIAFSPFIALYKFMGKDSSVIGDVGKNLSFNRGKGFIDYSPDLSGIIQLIFQPVLVIFALGVSLIFLSATNNILGPTAAKDGLLQAVGIELDSHSETGYQTFKVSNNGGHTTDISLKSFGGEYATSIFFDYFTWILTNILGILIMRNLMFWALASSKMTKGIADKVQSVGSDYVATRPVFGGYTYKTLTTQTPKFIDDVIEHYTDDTTEQAGKDMFANIKDNLPGSAKSQVQNAKFAVDSKEYEGKSKEEINDIAANKLLDGIGNQDRTDTHKTLDTGSTPAMTDLLSKTGVGKSNITGMVTDEKFWTNVIMKSDNPNGFLSNLTKIAKGDKDGKDLAIKRVGNYPTKVDALITAAKNGLATKAANGITVNPIIADPRTKIKGTHGYYKDGDKVYSITIGTGADGKPTDQIESIRKEIGFIGYESKKNSEKANALNSISNEELASDVIKDFSSVLSGITKVSKIDDKTTKGLYYDEDTKRFQGIDPK